MKFYKYEIPVWGGMAFILAFETAVYIMMRCYMDAFCCACWAFVCLLNIRSAVLHRRMRREMLEQTLLADKFLKILSADASGSWNREEVLEMIDRARRDAEYESHMEEWS